MTQVSIATDVTELSPVALLAADGSVWITLKLRWWDLATLLWWWLAPAHKRAWVTISTSSGQRVRTRAMLLAYKHVRVSQIHRTT